MGVLRRFPGTRAVTIIKNLGRDDEKRLTVQGNVQPEKGFFDLTAPIEEGDVVEVPDPRGDLRHLTVAEVNIHNPGSKLDHIEVRWARAPQVREAAVRRLGLEGLHPEILAVASNLFTDGHYAEAIFAAFRAVEVRVRRQSGIDASGGDLMARAFDAERARISVAAEQGRSGKDEQEGFKLIFMGAMQGIRNPKAHEVVQQNDPQRTLEYLAFASLLMRRLDDATSVEPGDASAH